MTYLQKELRALGVSELALELRALRMRLNITQAEVAAMAGVCKQTIVRFELKADRPEGSLRRSSTAKITALLERWRVQPPAEQRDKRGRKRPKGQDSGRQKLRALEPDVFSSAP